MPCIPIRNPNPNPNHLDRNFRKKRVVVTGVTRARIQHPRDVMRQQYVSITTRDTSDPGPGAFGPESRVIHCPWCAAGTFIARGEPGWGNSDVNVT